MEHGRLVSVRLVEAETSSESQIKGSLSDSRNLAVYSSSVCIKSGPCQLPYLHQLFTYNIVLTLCYHETCTYLSSIENPQNVHLGNFLRH